MRRMKDISLPLEGEWDSPGNPSMLLARREVSGIRLYLSKIEGWRQVQLLKALTVYLPLQDVEELFFQFGTIPPMT